MASTDKVLGLIGALTTLVDNFPMNILDLFKGKTYTCSFDFLMDVLAACGVNVDEWIGYLLEKIFSVEMSIEGGLENLQEQLANADFTEIEESKFLTVLEYSLKVILMTLLSSMYGCSSIPVLPNKVMDHPDPEIFGGRHTDIYGIDTDRLVLWQNAAYPGHFEIPVKLLDPMGMLEITPTTTAGKIFYEIGGSDTYYKKVENRTTLGTTSNTYRSSNINVQIYPHIENNGENASLYFCSSSSGLPENILIKVKYYDKTGNNLLEWSDNLTIASLKTNNSLPLSNILYIKSITINDKNYYKIVPNITCILTNNGIDEKYSDLFNYVNWYDNDLVLGANVEKNNRTSSTYSYEPLKEIPDNLKDVERRFSVPTIVSKTDPDFIVVYNGLNNNELYKAYDMNAFIWYVINKSLGHTQREINYTMWDTRLLAKKNKNSGTSFNETELNLWYASKSAATCEFLNPRTGQRVQKTDTIRPILQLKKSAFNTHGIEVSFPAQTYYKTRCRNKWITNSEDTSSPLDLTFNSTIYKFNWDYLNSIHILKPKILLSGFANYLTGGVLYELSNADFNFTRELLKSRVSSAIKKIIETDDMGVEDCYSTFSNDEFNSMLEDMLLSKNKMTYYGGDKNKVKKHDAESYYALIDSVNTSTTRVESTTKIKKLVDDILVTPGEEGSINYGIETSLDKSILLKLIWAIVMPIVESLFTPQVMLLIYINLCLTGGVKLDFTNGISWQEIFNFILNKIMSLISSIIKFIKDKIVELLYEFLLKIIVPIMLKWMLALRLEELQNWLNILLAALNCLPGIPKFVLNSAKDGSIDNVNYADIVSKDTTSTPETLSLC